MPVELIFVADATVDIVEASLVRRTPYWTGRGILEPVEACLQGICRQPEMYSVIHEEYRRALIRRFPYAIFYEYADTITIYSVFHTSRDLDKWHKRLR